MTDQPATRRAEPVISDLYSEYKNCDRWAVIVGISKYQYSSLNLRYADRDAEDLYQLLLTPNGGSFKSDHICKLTNEQATTGNINRALRSFLKKPAREDLVLIYFACHGSPDPDRPDNVYLLTHDTDPNDIAGTALPMEDIDRALKGILHSRKVIILADTCHSAAIGGGMGRRSVADDTQRMNRFFQEISRSKGGVALLTSAEANEVSFEDTKWGGGHGVFTHYLLEGMRGAADRDGDGFVTIGELFEYVRDSVKQATGYTQHPSIGTSAYDRNLPISISDPAKVASASPNVSNPKPTIQTQTFEFEIIEVDATAKEVRRNRKQGKVFAEYLGNSAVLEMVAIPGGEFFMGSPKEQGQPQEHPYHKVKVQPFFIGKFLVTQSQWRVVAALPKVNITLNPDPSRFKGDNRPVECINWFEATEFCERLSHYSGRNYRLPSESEWEYACRAGTTSSFHFGEAISRHLACIREEPGRNDLISRQMMDNSDFRQLINNNKLLQNFVGNRRDSTYYLSTTDVGHFKVANAFGLYDMHGNVSEWCLDLWHINYNDAPTDGSAWLSGEDVRRVHRGGGWNSLEDYCYSAYRDCTNSENEHHDRGFRVVCASI